MSEISYRNWSASSDKALLEKIGSFIKDQRLLQNKTQDQLAGEAGIVRSTLSLFERGENTSMLVFIQLLRALGLVNLLQEFQVKQQISPIQLALQDREKRSRARNTRKISIKRKSNW